MLLYKFFKTTVKYALQFYCKRLAFVGMENIPIGKNQPVLFCSSHSNSFLDALFIASCFKEEVFPLARGDAFREPLLNSILREFRMLPIFRAREDEANAATKNEQSFQECQALFRQGKWVLIFPEGICKHQSEILPLKKGAALLAQRAWAADIPMQVIPVGINYDSLWKWGKKCDVIFGKPLLKEDFQDLENISSFYDSFNAELYASMTTIFPTPYQWQNTPLYNSYWSTLLYYVGWVFQAPIYGISYLLGKKAAGKTIFFDSAVVGFLSILMPIYYILMAILIYWIW